MTKDYFNRSDVLLAAENHFMQAIIQAGSALNMADLYAASIFEADNPQAVISFYKSLADCHVRTAKAIVQHLFNENELSLDDARAINHRLVWFNYEEPDHDDLINF